MVGAMKAREDPRSEGLIWASDEDPGIRRRRSGRGFSYRDPEGRLVQDALALNRIRFLAIPPAWDDVWICPDPTGHIQATGRDARGRKQYRYHHDWTVHAASHKFSRLSAFAGQLPKLREQVERDLSLRGPCKDKVLATTVRLLEITLIRVGNAAYVKQNRSFGLTTLLKRHLDVDGSVLTFEFRGKSGKEHRVKISDRRLARVVRTLEGLPGQMVFKYRDAEGDLCPVTSDDVNAYIRRAMGEQFSAKDFRTWAATVSAARVFREFEPPASPRDAHRKVSACMKLVAGLLGNTPTVCRASYVHPRVIELYEGGTIAKRLPEPHAEPFEKALARLLT